MTVSDLRKKQTKELQNLLSIQTKLNELKQLYTNSKLDVQKIKFDLLQVNAKIEILKESISSLSEIEEAQSEQPQNEIEYLKEVLKTNQEKILEQERKIESCNIVIMRQDYEIEQQKKLLDEPNPEKRKPQTVIEWLVLEGAKHEWHKEAIHNLNKLYALDKAESLHRAIHKAFKWEHTSQGRNYWNNIFKDLKSQNK